MDKSPIGNLSNEVIAFILNELDLFKLIECRLISKRFKFIIDNHQFYNIKKEKLIIFKLSYLSNFERRKKLPIDFRNSFEFNKNLGLDDILSYKFFKEFYLNLKELYFFIFNCQKFNVEIINQFQNLEVLHFDSLALEKYEFIINLPNLKKFSVINNENIFIEFMYVDKPARFIIIESKLEKIEINPYFNVFIFKYPEFVNSVISRKDCEYNLDLAKFKNLRILRTSKKIRLDILKSFKKLETIYIDCFYDICKSEIEKESIEFANDLLVLRNSKELKLNWIIYLNDIELIKPIEDFQIENYNILKTQLLNYDSLKNTPYRSETLEYNFLIDFFKENVNLFKDKEKDKLLPELPFDFFIKFNNIKHIFVNKIRLDDKFIFFLNNCNCLVYLEIRKCELYQSLLDHQLPFVSYWLNELVLEDVKELENKKLNLNFILNLKKISSLETNIEMDLEVAVKLFNDSKSLKNFVFIYLGKKIEKKKGSYLNITFI